MSYKDYEITLIKKNLIYIASFVCHLNSLIHLYDVVSKLFWMNSLQQSDER